MNVKDLEGLYDYGYWANAKLFRVMSTMPQEDFTRTVAGSYGSIRNTMVHSLSAECWLDRCGGLPRGAKLESADYATVESLVSTCGKVEASMREFLSDLKDGDLTREIEFTLGGPEKRSMPLGQLLRHGANHGVHHRGQVALLLRVLGHTPGNVDLLIYYSEKGGTA